MGWELNLDTVIWDTDIPSAKCPPVSCFLNILLFKYIDPKCAAWRLFIN